MSRSVSIDAEISPDSKRRHRPPSLRRALVAPYTCGLEFLRFFAFSRLICAELGLQPTRRVRQPWLAAFRHLASIAPPRISFPGKGRPTIVSASRATSINRSMSTPVSTPISSHM